VQQDVVLQGQEPAVEIQQNPDSPWASTAFVANSRFFPAKFPVGREK